jgi:membrane fusion protein, heavy metal efflux system
LHKGRVAEIVFPAYPGEVFQGKVLFVSNVLDPDTRRTKARIPSQIWASDSNPVCLRT